MPRPPTRDPLPPHLWPFPERGRTVSIQRAMKLLGASRATIYRMAENGELRTGDGVKPGMRVNLTDLFIAAFHGGERPRRPTDEMNREAAAAFGVPPCLVDAPARLIIDARALRGILDDGPGAALRTGRRR